MSDGIIYLLGPPAFAERIAVSVYSLRKFWEGPITLFATDSPSYEIGSKIMKAAGGTCTYHKGSRRRRHGHYATKTCLPLWTPYDRTVFLDGDTLVVGGPLDPLFENPLTVTNFGEWVTCGRKVSGRIKRLRGISPIIDGWIEEIVKERLPAINTGVMGWHKTDSMEWARLWNELTLKAPPFIADELAMQVIANRFNAHVMDDEWNCSPLYGAHKDRVKIWHFHGDKHLKKEPGRKVWLPALHEAIEQNFAGLAEWVGKYDSWVRAELEQQRV